MPLTPELARRFVRPIFFETGTDGGGGVAVALAAGAVRVVSVEINPGLAQKARARFVGEPRVTVLQGNSAELLGSAMSAVNELATVWLDAHQTLSDVVPRGQSPILQELGALAVLPCRSHVILIDDIRCFREGFPWRHFDPKTERLIELGEIEAAVRTINPAYRISYEDAHERKDVLVACL